ncbi:MAG: glycosyltransferase family 39 protein [Acetobacteraceae bacterium]
MLSATLPSKAPVSAEAQQAAAARLGDVAIAAALVLLAAAILLPCYGDFPMATWDESRNANNAIEMAAAGHWLITTFGGVPDHWNTKPPLLIWLVAALLRAGVPPLLALRLPSFVAALAIVAVLFAYCRWCLGSRLAGVLAGLLFLASPLFFGPHIARTGDYDAPLSLFVLVLVIAFERYAHLVARPERRRWLVLAAAAAVLGILTKGVAALLVAPGLLVFAAVRGRVARMAGDPALWCSVLAAVAVCAGYYLGREALDPGYLRAVWDSELGGRYGTTLDAHAGGPLYYVRILLRLTEPAALLVPFLVWRLVPWRLITWRLITWRSWSPPPSARRIAGRDSLLICLLAGASLLLAISSAGTKAYWYAAPLVPLLSLAGGVALASLAGTSGQGSARPGFTVALLAACLGALTVVGQYHQFAGIVTAAGSLENGQLWYGQALEQFRREGVSSPLVIVDGGVANDAGFAGYTPVADFYRKYATLRGEQVEIASTGTPPAHGIRVLTCDPRLVHRYRFAAGFQPVFGDARCVTGPMGAN